jgi:hypothetical protein
MFPTDFIGGGAPVSPSRIGTRRVSQRDRVPGRATLGQVRENRIAQQSVGNFDLGGSNHHLVEDTLLVSKSK